MTLEQSIGRVIWEVCARHNVTRDAVLTKDRRPPVVAARNEAMFRCRIELEAGWLTIGREFGRHHTTAVSAVRQYLASQGKSFACASRPGGRRSQPRADLCGKILGQARIIAAQAHTIAEQARQIEFLAQRSV